jgi:glycosyltransferase involved in cell wall biosynthesis
VHLAILTQYYPPETGAPQNRLADLAERVRALGHEVTVITAMPNYPSGTVRTGYTRKVVWHEERDGVRVLRSWIYGRRGRGTAHQLAAYASFAASSLLTTPGRLRKADVLLWESPPLFLAPTAELLARLMGARLVMNVSDLWPESAIELGLLGNDLLIRGFMTLARRAYCQSVAVFGQTQGILDGIEAVAPGTPTFIFPNGVDCERFWASPRDEKLAIELGLPAGCTVFAYAGNFGRAQALGQVVEAARHLLNSFNDVAVLLIGDGPVKDEIVADACDLDPKRFLVRSSVDVSQMAGLLSLVDVAVVPLADRSIFEGARPSKMFELLASETPFVFCGRGEGAELAAHSGAGRVVSPERPERLSAAVAELIRMSPPERLALGKAGRAWVTTQFDRNVVVAEVVERLIDLAGQPKVRRRRSRMRPDARPSP